MFSRKSQFALGGFAATMIGLAFGALPTVREPTVPCSIPPCEESDVICRLTSLSVFVDPDDMDPFPLTVKTPIALSDITMSANCIPQDVDLALCAVVLEAPAGSPLPDLGFTDPPFVTDDCPPGAGCIYIPAGFTSEDVGQLCVTFPDGTLFGEYIVQVQIFERNSNGTKGMFLSDCDASITLSGSVTAAPLIADGERPELGCAAPGETIDRIFEVVNHTDDVRTVEIVITSTQMTSSQPGDPSGHHDHFPIAFCPDEPPERDEKDTTIPTLTDTLTLGPNSSQDVCVTIRSYEGCQCGSRCEVKLVATDVTDGPVDPPAGSITTASQDYMTNEEAGSLCTFCGPDEDSTLNFGNTTAGSWGTPPEISVWSQRTGSWIQVGSGYSAILLNDVGLHQSITQPMLLLGTQTTIVDLGPFGAPGFELLVVPDAILAPNATNSIHYAEYGTFLPNDSSLVGQHVYAQWVLQDPTGNARGIALTDAAEIVLTY